MSALASPRHSRSRQEPALVLAHRPAQGFGQDGVFRLIQEVVDGLPADLVTARCGDGHGHPPPVVSLRVVKEVPAVDASKAPVEPGLMLVMFRAELGHHALPVGSGDRVEVGTSVRPGVLGQDGIAPAGSIDRQRSSPLILPDDQTRLSRSRRLLAATQPPERRGSGADRREDDRDAERQASLRVRS